MAANHSQFIQLNAPVERIVSVLRDRGFCTKLNLELKSENPTDTGVWFRFHHGVTFTSWGEKVTVTLTPMSAQTTKVEVHSECGMPTQVIDWGKNKQNVCNILEYIEASTPVNTADDQARTCASAAAGGVRFCCQGGKQISPDSVFCCYCGAKLS